MEGTRSGDTLEFTEVKELLSGGSLETRHGLVEHGIEEEEKTKADLFASAKGFHQRRLKIAWREQTEGVR